jgi:hypothetical protein
MGAAMKARVDPSAPAEQKAEAKRYLDDAIERSRHASRATMENFLFLLDWKARGVWQLLTYIEDEDEEKTVRRYKTFEHLLSKTHFCGITARRFRLAESLYKTGFLDKNQMLFVGFHGLVRISTFLENEPGSRGKDRRTCLKAFEALNAWKFSNGSTVEITSQRATQILNTTFNIPNNRTTNWKAKAQTLQVENDWLRERIVQLERSMKDQGAKIPPEKREKDHGSRKSGASEKHRNGVQAQH